MRVIGIDPGTTCLGYGVVEECKTEIRALTYGIIKFPKSPIEAKLSLIFHKLSQIFNDYHPEEMSIEEPFVGDNVRAAFSIGRAQAVAMLVSSENNAPVYRYSPSQIKQQVANYGAGPKEQINMAVKLYLRISDPDLQQDAADALATAICHINYKNFISRVSQDK